MRKVCVVGSGPAGATAASILLKSGCEVTLLDVGFEIEQDLRPLMFGETDAGETPASRQQLLSEIKRRRSALSSSKSALPEKLPFGSRFVYRDIPGAELRVEAPATVVSSLALGGLSNVWGANVSALRAIDMADWPFDVAELSPYFAELDEIADVSSTVDAIDELYPCRIGREPHYPLGPQGRHVLQNIRRNEADLIKGGIHAGRAKIAVTKRYSAGGRGCVSCGFCMHGCPYNAIFNAANVIRQLKANPNFHYVPGVLVERFDELERGVKVVGRTVVNDEYFELETSKLYIGAGVLGTTAITARSLGMTEREFTIRDSQKWYFPYLLGRRARGSLTSSANTLAQIFLQLTELSSTKNTVHCQLYGFNDLLVESFRKLFGPFTDRLVQSTAFFFERVMIGMVYLHSNDSGTLRFRVSPAGVPDVPLGALTGAAAAHSEQVFREFMATLSRSSKLLGGRPFPTFAKKGMPGRSQHFGGSLPMALERTPSSTDILGRPFGCDRVHLVDSTVMPSVPGTPTTYPMMANAARIAHKSLS